jgi:transcriptional antiterminator NusG
LNEEPRDDLQGADEAAASSEGSFHAQPPLLSDSQVSPSQDADKSLEVTDEDREDLKSTAEWTLGKDVGPGADTAIWKKADDNDAAADDAAQDAVEDAADAIDEAIDDDQDNEVADPDEDLAESAVDVDAATSDADVTEPTNLDWYILKVASNREESIKDGLLRRARIAGLDHFIKEIIVPTETISEYKNGKRRQRKQKVWPGYLVVHMEINEDTWFLVRETPGIGDFTGAAGKPTPMLREEVEKILRLVRPAEERKKDVVKDIIPYKVGDRVKIKEGTFQDFEGEVESVDQAKSSVTVMINIFGRPTPAEVSSWQLEAL